MNKLLWILMAALAPISGTAEIESAHLQARQHSTPSLSERNNFCEKYFLPDDHWLKSRLDSIFETHQVLKSENDFLNAGFKIVCKRASSMIVAQHDALPGYLIKAYIDSDRNNGESPAKWLFNRCLGVENIRNLVRTKKIKYFTLPDKWIYLLPGFDQLNDKNNAILVVTDMKLATPERSKWAWKNRITPRHLDELYCILSHGFASTYLCGNIPYTRKGRFTCIDTEYPYRSHLPYHKVSSYLNEEMRAYWEELVRKGKSL